MAIIINKNIELHMTMLCFYFQSSPSIASSMNLIFLAFNKFSLIDFKYILDMSLYIEFSLKTFS